MAVGQNGIAVPADSSTGHPPTRNASVSTHIHKGSPESTVGGPGVTTAPGANQQGSAGGGSPYGAPASPRV